MFLYKLSNGNYITVGEMSASSLYSYNYWDGKTKKLIDGGVFECESDDREDILAEALSWCDLPADIGWKLVEEYVEYDVLERMGFSGF